MVAKINLSGGEWKLMKRLWDKSPRTITELVSLLKEETGWTKHTVISMLSRMEAKGAVRYEPGTRAKLYYPCVPYEDVAVREAENFLSRVYGGSIGMMVSSLVNGRALTKEDIKELHEILADAERREKPDA